VIVRHTERRHGGEVMKRKITIELTVEQAAKIYDLLGAGKLDLCGGHYYSTQQEATADRAYDIVTQTLREAFGDRLFKARYDTP
jgi:hypothetical protein